MTKEMLKRNADIWTVRRYAFHHKLHVYELYPENANNSEILFAVSAEPTASSFRNSTAILDWTFTRLVRTHSRRIPTGKPWIWQRGPEYFKPMYRSALPSGRSALSAAHVIPPRRRMRSPPLPTD